MFALLTTRLSDGRRGSEPYAINPFTIIAEGAVDFVAGDLRVLPGQTVEVWTENSSLMVI
jgi:hypothetical protein